MNRPRIRDDVRGRRTGAVTVEFALTISVLWIVLFGAWDFSRATMMLHTIDNASYEGSRRGIVPGASADDIRDTVSAVLSAAYVRSATVAIEPPILLPTTREITVTVSAPMNQNAWVAPLFLNDRNFTSSYKLTREDFATVSVP